MKPALSRHVQQLRALEGHWQFTSMEVDGKAIPREMLAYSRLLIDGDRFRMESAEATYDGQLMIDADAVPARIDIEFNEGPEAGNRCYGLYELSGDELTLCLGVVGASRPESFMSRPGSGHALERLRRASAERPANVTGGTRQPAARSDKNRADPSAFDVEMTPLLRRLEGDWLPVQLVTDGKPMAEQWLAYGSRTCVGNEVKVVFGGQVMVHAKVRLDDRVTPVAVDYFHLSGGQAGTVTYGILEWVGDEVRVLMAGPGGSRPEDFSVRQGTLSQWRRRSD